jgi:hypothetical protein
MTLRAMPMVVLNMGSEMLYILNQRLHAQNIARAKREKVLVDVVKTMFAPHFISALFQVGRLVLVCLVGNVCWLELDLDGWLLGRRTFFSIGGVPLPAV